MAADVQPHPGRSLGQHQEQPGDPRAEQNGACDVDPGRPGLSGNVTWALAEFAAGYFRTWRGDA